MKKTSGFLVLVLLFSCNYFDVKKTSSETILNEELQTFNWNAVDAYPSFSTCDTSLNKQAKKECFQNTMANHIYRKLEQEQFIVTKDINDTIMIQFQISETGKISLINIKIDTVTHQEIPQIKNIIIKSIETLPKIYPAIKRGQQVRTEFKLPIVINVK